MSWLSKFFGGGGGGAASAPQAEPVAYKAFTILPQPIADDGGFRICALIEGEIDGQPRSHKMIRADVIRDADEAAEASVAKAKQMIDQMGARLFGA